MDEHPEHPTLSWNLYGKALPQVYPSNQYNINCVFLMLKLDRCTTELTAHYHMAELPSFAISLLALFLTIRQQVTSKQCAMHMMAVLSQEHTMASLILWAPAELMVLGGPWGSLSHGSWTMASVTKKVTGIL
jgi:hypothetical protein